jgi:U5 small nuclear ribonucleoprotein component
MAAIS